MGCPAVLPVCQEGLEEARRALAEARREKGMLWEQLREQREPGMRRDPGMLREPRMMPEQGRPPGTSQDEQQEVRGGHMPNSLTFDPNAGPCGSPIKPCTHMG